eukprot:1029305-Rhodomonas_salina.1
MLRGDRRPDVGSEAIAADMGRGMGSTGRADVGQSQRAEMGVDGLGLERVEMGVDGLERAGARAEEP